MAKAVIFDKDGVIVHSSPLHFISFSLALKEIGFVLKKENKYKLMGRSAKENIERLLGNKIESIDIDKLLKRKDFHFKKIFNPVANVVPGVIPFLKKLKKSRVPTALATSSRIGMTDFIVDSLKIREYFDIIITAEDVRAAKPDPELFLAAAKELGVSPSDCVVFEDSYAGIEAAKKADMKIVLVTTSHRSHKEAHLAIKDFTRITVKSVFTI